MILSLLLTLPITLQAGTLEEALQGAATLATRGNYTAAVKILKDAGAGDSKDVQVRATLANYTMKKVEGEIASGAITGLDVVDAWLDVADMMEEICALPGAPASAWVDRSEAILNSGDLTLSLEVIDQGLSALKDSAVLLQQRGRVEMAQARKAEGTGDMDARDEHYAAAEEAFRASMTAAPKTAAPAERLGELLWTRWHASEREEDSFRQGAIDAWTAAAEADPNGINLDNMNAWLGAAGMPALDVVVAARPKDPLSYWYRGMAHHAAGAENWDELKADFEKVLELNPQFTNAYFFLADGAVKRGVWQATQQGDDAKAKAAYRASAGYWAKYLKDFGGTYRASLAQQADRGRGVAEQMDYLAGQLVNNGKFIPRPDIATGITLLDFAVAVAPDFAYGWQNLAFFQREAGEYEKSRDAYAKAHELVPDDPQVMSDYAVIFHFYLKTNDEMAFDLYERAAARAQELLDGGGLSDADNARFRTTLRDARNNIAALKKGKRTQ